MSGVDLSAIGNRAEPEIRKAPRER